MFVKTALLYTILLATAALTCLSAPAKADTLDSTNELVAYFTTSPNAEQYLTVVNIDPLTLTGNPILTLTLYDGGTVLGTAVGAPFHDLGIPNEFLSYLISTSDAPFFFEDGARGLASSFASIDNGTVVGTLVYTVSGGSVSGFNPADFQTFIGLTPITANFAVYPLQGKTASTPEPSSLLMLGYRDTVLGRIRLEEILSERGIQF